MDERIMFRCAGPLKRRIEKYARREAKRTNLRVTMSDAIRQLVLKGLHRDRKSEARDEASNSIPGQ